MLLLLLGAWPAWGAEVRLIPSLLLQEEYNDNILLSSGAEQSSFITTVAPGLDLVSRSETGEAGLSARLDQLLYQGHRNLDDLEQNYRASFSHRPSQQATLAAAARFIRESRPDRHVEATGLVETAQSDRQAYSASATYLWNETTQSSLGYSYSHTDYDEATSANNSSHSVNFGLSRDLSGWAPKLLARANLGLSRELYPSTTVEGVSAILGFSRALDELWSLSLDAGGRFTRAEFTQPSLLGPVVLSHDDLGWVAGATLAYRGEQGGANLNFNRSLATTGGRDGATERTGATLNLHRRFSYEFSGSLAASYVENQAEAGELGASTIDERSWRITPALRYEFSRQLAAEASYQYARVDNRLSRREAEQNRFMLRLVSRVDFLE